MQSQNQDLWVRIEKPLNTPLGTLIGEIRIWLDHQGIQPAGLKPITLDSGVAFDVNFRNPLQACLFRAAFATDALR